MRSTTHLALVSPDPWGGGFGAIVGMMPRVRKSHRYFSQSANSRRGRWWPAHGAAVAGYRIQHGQEVGDVVTVSAGQWHCERCVCCRGVRGRYSEGPVRAPPPFTGHLI